MFKLLDKLLLKRIIQYFINITNAKSININIYLLYYLSLKK